eukprot:scaffold5764_cov146-Ochromonas_danica.AAC.1
MRPVYSITLRATNILGNNGIQVTIGDSFNMKPQVRVYGANSGIFYRWQTLVLYSYAYYPSCAGGYTNQTISYSWTAYQVIQLLPNIASSSKDPRTFTLSPYTLEANSNYTFRIFTSVALATGEVAVEERRELGM